MPKQILAELVKKEKLLDGLYRFSVIANDIVKIA